MQRRRIPIITWGLVLVNVLVFFYTEWLGSSYDSELLIRLGALYEPCIVENGEYYRLVSHFFMHIGFEHLFNNMVSLLVLGYSLEFGLGRIRFTILYFLSGILAGVSSIVYNIYVSGMDTVSCGASGAIFGLTGALLVLMLKGIKRHGSSAVLRYLLFIGMSLYTGFQDPSIDNIAHIGGCVAGCVLCLILSRKKQMEVSYES